MSAHPKSKAGSTPPIQMASPLQPHAPNTTYRSYGPNDHPLPSQNTSYRGYHSTSPSQTVTYPPSSTSDSWALPPPPGQSSWTDHTRPNPSDEVRTLPAPLASIVRPATKGEGAPDVPSKIGSPSPILSRLRERLVGGRVPLSRTWEKASFAEECRSAPPTLSSTPIPSNNGQDLGQNEDPEMGIGGKKRDKKGRSGVLSEDGAMFSPSGRPVSLYASPAALRAFKPLPSNLPGTPAQDPPRGLASA